MTREPSWRSLSAAGGVILGVSLIVAGQLILAFLDMRARLVRIDRRIRAAMRRPDRESPLAERLRPRQ
jgi:hypothetical protein